MKETTSPELRNEISSEPEKLVSGPRLLETLFDEASRPTLRTLRTWTKQKSVPFIRLGHLIFFYPPDVRAALSKRNTIRGGAR